MSAVHDEPADLQRRFGGLARLFGVDGAARIRAAHVAIVGIGGVGSWAAEALARSAVGRLTLIDLDHVAESNINRQVHALTTTMGQSKVQAMAERIALINPECKVDCIEEFVDPSNWPGILPAPVHAVIDACDQVRAKTAMAAWALRTRHDFISVGAAGGKKMAHKVDVDDLAHATHDPLLAQLRYRLRREHGFPREPGKRFGVEAIYSDEHMAGGRASGDTSQADGAQSDAARADAPQAGGAGLSCAGYGSLVTVTAAMGMAAAARALDFARAARR